MKLLSKNEIAKAKNADKSKEIAEGLKISRRVDSLRELAAKEEESLAKFRTESLAAIMKDIGNLEEQKTALEAEIKALRAEKAVGLTDIEREKNEIGFFKKVLDKREETLKGKAIELEIKDEQLKKTLQAAEDELLRAKNHKEEAAQIHRNTLKTQQVADAQFENNRKEHQEFLAQKAEIEKNLFTREQVVVSIELSLAQQEIMYKEREKKLTEKEIQLEDQRKTLERAMNRIKQ